MILDIKTTTSCIVTVSSVVTKDETKNNFVGDMIVILGDEVIKHEHFDLHKDRESSIDEMESIHYEYLLKIS